MFPLFTSTALASGGHRVAGGFVTWWSWEVLWQNGKKSDSKWDCGKLLFSLQDKVLLQGWPWTCNHPVSTSRVIHRIAGCGTMPVLETQPCRAQWMFHACMDLDIFIVLILFSGFPSTSFLTPLPVVGCSPEKHQRPVTVCFLSGTPALRPLL